MDDVERGGAAGAETSNIGAVAAGSTRVQLIRRKRHHAQPKPLDLAAGSDHGCRKGHATWGSSALRDLVVTEAQASELKLSRDSFGQAKIEWSQAGAWKIAWVQTNRSAEKNWAGTDRYLQVVRKSDRHSGPGGNSTDFPIFRDDLSDQEILIAFVTSTCALTGNRLPPIQEWEIDPTWERQ